MESDIENENKALETCIDLIYSYLIEEYTIYSQIEIPEEKIDDKFFDNNSYFYSNLKKNSANIFIFAPNLIENIESKFNQRNLLVYLKLLKHLISQNIDIYKDSIVKIGISLVVNFFRFNTGKKMVNSKDYFYICRKELEKKYNISFDNTKTELDELWIEQGTKQIKLYQKIKISYFFLALDENIKYYDKLKEYDVMEKVEQIKKKFKNDLNKSNFNDLEKDYFKNINYREYISKFIEIQVKSNGYSSNMEEYNNIKETYYNHFFYNDIINIDNIDEYLILLDTASEINKIGSFINKDNLYNEAKRSYESLFKDKNNDITEELKQIINDDNFIEKINNILKSNSVQKYFLNKRRFKSTDSNDVEILNKEELNFDDELQSAYKNLIKNIDNSYNWFKNLIIFKYLSPKKRAFVSPYMRIILNPLFIEFSDSLKNKTKIRSEILQAYLIIIIIHEIIDLLKFMKEKFTFQNIFSTPKDKEGEEVLINFLFGLPITIT